MSTTLRPDVCVHLPPEAHEQRVIEANRRMAALGIARVDRGGGKYRVERKAKDRDA